MINVISQREFGQFLIFFFILSTTPQEISFVWYGCTYICLCCSFHLRAYYNYENNFNNPRSAWSGILKMLITSTYTAKRICTAHRSTAWEIFSINVSPTLAYKHNNIKLQIKNANRYIQPIWAVFKYIYTLPVQMVASYSYSIRVYIVEVTTFNLHLYKEHIS